MLTGAIIIASSVAAVRIGPAFITWRREVLASAAELAAEAAQAEIAIRSVAEIQDSLAARGERFVQRGASMFTGETPTIAASVLAELVTEAAAQAGLEMAAVDVRADSAHAAPFTSAMVRASFTGDARGVVALLQTLEQGPKLVVIRELAISHSDPAPPNSRPEALRLDLTVESLVLPTVAER